MKNIMLDLETMGVNPDAAIIAIGAVEFDTGTGDIGERFYTVIDLASSVKHGGVIDASTVLWWMQQSDAARSEFERPGLDIIDALTAFSVWVAGLGPEVSVWGNGAAFDNVILASAYRRIGLPPPWPHWLDRCYRTIKDRYPEVLPVRTGVFHRAVDDAESQARHLINMLRVEATPGERWYDASVAKPPVDEACESGVVLCREDGVKWPFVGRYNSETDSWIVAHYTASNISQRVTHWKYLGETDER